MQIVRVTSGGRDVAAVRRDDGTFVSAQPSLTVADLVRLDRPTMRRAVDELAAVGEPIRADAQLAPVDRRMEVWAAGVTYIRSRDARVAESTTADPYDRVYDADRPELFFKSAAWRVAGPEGSIAVRRDSAWNVPEPELALVCNASGEIVGYTICNDVSSRSIEGENPLYLPQAKVYLGGCAVGPGIVPWWEIENPRDLEIRLRIERAGEERWSGAYRTSQLHRRLEDLVEHLFREDVFPDGVVLSTGTGIVPDDSFTLETGDTVEIDIERIGTLRNRVVLGKAGMQAAT